MPAGADPASKHIIWWNSNKGPKDISVQDLENASAAFDGFVVQNVRGSKDTFASNMSLAWGAFTTRHYTLDSSDSSGDYVGDQLDALRRLPSTPMPDRFLRINTSPYETERFDWSDDAFWDNVVNNLTVASQICHDANLNGVFLDTEQYHRPTSPNEYMYGDLVNHGKDGGRSFEDLDALVEKRGRQVIQALNSHCPNMTIIISFGYITISQHASRGTLASRGYLLAPFLDGMLDGSTSGTTFVDGFEGGYWHNDVPRFFDMWRHNIVDRDSYTAKFQKRPDKYARQYQYAVGLFLDRDRDMAGRLHVYGWCGDGKSEVFYSPGRLAKTVELAAKASDKYVWVYSVKPNIWLRPDSAGGLPSAYVHAIREGMAHGSDPSLGPLPNNTSTAPESAVCK